MDTDQLVSHGRARFDHAAAKKLLREKYQAKLVFAYNGGLFRTGPEVMAFLSLYHDTNIVLQDLYENPIEVNARELLDLMRARWQEQMTAWLIEHQDLSKKR